MEYQGAVIRPPSEADSIILQVAVGCPHNSCTFCGAYRAPEQQFHLKDAALVERDLEFAAQHCRRLNAVFLADGDALIIPQQRLLSLCRRIREMLPWVRRISLYASSRSILSRSPEELAALKAAGLGRIYMGLESGCDQVLRDIRKGAAAAEMVAAGRRAREAGLFLSVTCLLGIGGAARSQEHAEATAAALNQMQPNQIAVLTLMLLDNTELGQAAKGGRFQLPGQLALLHELRTMLAVLTECRCQFHANHASNYLSLTGRLPKDRERFLAQIGCALAGTARLKPEWLRGL
ncbi:radical SAM protein [Candidatus Electronema sp. TJ]|uniref:radical SAM protein n=1 Tax=Candidatus Electronema sp. TJ TaxID=3401573 RepID=UPI003AA932D1